MHLQSITVPCFQCRSTCNKCNMKLMQQPEEEKQLISNQLISIKTHLAFSVFGQFFIFRQTRVFRITCFLSFKSSLVVNSFIAKLERVALSKLYTIQSLIKRYLIYTITTPNQSAVNIILGTQIFSTTCWKDCSQSFVSN